MSSNETYVEEEETDYGSSGSSSSDGESPGVSVVSVVILVVCFASLGLGMLSFWCKHKSQAFESVTTNPMQADGEDEQDAGVAAEGHEKREEDETFVLVQQKGSKKSGSRKSQRDAGADFL